MKQITKNIIISILVFLAIASLFTLYLNPTPPAQEVGIGAVVEKIQADQVSSVTVVDNQVEVTLKDNTRLTANKEPGESFTTLLKNYNVAPEKIQAIAITYKQDTGLGFWLSALLPFLIPLLLFGAILYFMMRQVQGANSRAMTFGQSRARESGPNNQKNQTTFKDVAGAKEAKQELEEIVEFLRNPRKFLNLGARIPKGVLLVGPPGTGKTMLARAVAGEANVPFFSISGSEFVEMFVGVGASRVRDLFRKAKKSSPCIIFIDELDAVGRQRGAGLGGSNDEREQTLNQILVEMDGFDVSTNVIIMAATNRPDILDRALLRPGRFDRQVTLDHPDINDREAILKIHARKKPMEAEINLRQIAERTPGFTGADLNNLLNEAAILTARRNKTKISMAEITDSVEKVLLGPERRSHILDEKEKKVTAYHEAGHALVSHILPDADPVHKVSIISRGRAAGYTLKVPSRDKHLQTKTEFLAELAVLVAGYTVEKMIFNELTTGASNDLKVATRLARRMIMEYGMSPLGARTFGEREELIFLGREIHEQRDYSEKVAEAIDQQITTFITQAITTAEELVTKHRSELDMIAAELLKKETIEKSDFEALFKKS